MSTWLLSPGARGGTGSDDPAICSAPLGAAAAINSMPSGPSTSDAPRSGSLPVLVMRACSVRSEPGVSPPSAVSSIRADSSAAPVTAIVTCAGADESVPSSAT
jgi:hypothetical protein